MAKPAVRSRAGFLPHDIGDALDVGPLLHHPPTTLLPGAWLTPPSAPLPLELLSKVQPALLRFLQRGNDRSHSRLQILQRGIHRLHSLAQMSRRSGPLSKGFGDSCTYSLRLICAHRFSLGHFKSDPGLPTNDGCQPKHHTRLGGGVWSGPRCAHSSPRHACALHGVLFLHCLQQGPAPALYGVLRGSLAPAGPAVPCAIGGV